MEKPSLNTAKAGAMRFNTDSSQMEIYDGNQWTGILGTSPELQTGGTRAMMLSGAYPVNTDIQTFNIATTGNAVNSGFDNLQEVLFNFEHMPILQTQFP